MPIPKIIVKMFEHLAQRKVVEVIKFSETEAFPVTDSTKCVFLSPDHRCMIYDDRPDTCRNYGQTDELPCPYVKKNGNPRNTSQVRHWQRKINRDVDSRMKRLERIAAQSK